MKLTVKTYTTNNPTKRDPQVYLLGDGGYNVARLDVAGRHPTSDPLKVAEHIALCVSVHGDLLSACTAAEHALRSYQYGNSAPDLAKEIADEIHTAIARARGE